MTSMSPVLAAGVALIVGVLALALALEVTWSWAKQNGLVTSGVIATRSARAAAAMLGGGAGIAVALAAVSAWRTAYTPTDPAVARRPVRAVTATFCSTFAIGLVLGLLGTVLAMVIVWIELNAGGGPRPALR